MCLPTGFPANHNEHGSEAEMMSTSSSFPQIETLESKESGIDLESLDSYPHNGNSSSAPPSCLLLDSCSEDDLDSGCMSPRSDGVGKRRKSSIKRTTSCASRSGSSTPKSVTFADALGLELTNHFSVDMDSPPSIPTSAFEDLKIEDFIFPVGDRPASIMIRTLTTCFADPLQNGTRCLYDQVHRCSLKLESVKIEDLGIHGSILVKNLSFHKDVALSYTLNNWHSAPLHLEASYNSSIEEEGIDRFQFAFWAPYYFEPGSEVDFCIRFQAGGPDGPVYWDNNYGKNYTLQCTQKPLELINFV